MPSGGHARSGPPPDPNALRRNRKDDAAWTVLPAEGRKGAPPKWPLTEAEGPDAAREIELWQRLWAMPQATQWEAAQQQFEVALYVRRLAEVEVPGAPTNLGTLARQMADALGLTIPGMRTARWKIATDQVKAKREERQTTAPARPTARDRFSVVDGVA